jgi:ABC-type multidrug transport system fused ATPase/permease subunit
MSLSKRFYLLLFLFKVFFCTLIATWNFVTGAPYFEIFGTAPACRAAANVFEILDTEPQINLYKNLGTKPKTMQGDVSFKSVHFENPSTDVNKGK